MRDEMVGRLWIAHQEAFSIGIIRIGGRLARLNRAVPMPLKLMAAVIGAGIATLSTPSPVQAAQTLETAPASIAVSYADLNLTSQAGRHTLAARIDRAARRLCRPDTIGALGERSERRACFRTATASAERQAAIATAQTETRNRTIVIAVR